MADPNLLINTEDVIAIAGRINTDNDRIRDGFKVVESKNAQLDEAWDGVVARKAMSAFNDAKAKYNSERYHIIREHIHYLQTVIAPNYRDTEDKNRSRSSEIG